MFAYCNNSPIMFSDFTGYSLRPFSVAISDSGSATPNYTYIDDQKDPDIASSPFGLSNIGNSGCGAVAIHNAQISMGKPSSLKGVSTYIFLTGQQNIFGFVGMMPSQVASVLTQMGYVVHITSNPDEIVYFSSVADANILWYAYKTSSAPYIGAHFTAYEPCEGGYLFHNVGANGTAISDNPYSYGLLGDRCAVVGIFIWE